jgi:membrane protein required for colicin V production
MLIDLAFIVMVVLAIFKGLKNGLIIAVFSLVAFIVGIAAALKFSALVAGWLGPQVPVTQKWLPLISFAIIFIGVGILIRMGARLIEKTVQFAMLGWVNKIGGILFYILLNIIILSILIFYAISLKIISADTVKQSQTYNFIQPFGPAVINNIGTVIPVFKDLFLQLERFFDGITLPK